MNHISVPGFVGNVDIDIASPPRGEQVAIATTTKQLNLSHETSIGRQVLQTTQDLTGKFRCASKLFSGIGFGLLQIQIQLVNYVESLPDPFTPAPEGGNSGITLRKLPSGAIYGLQHLHETRV